MRRQLRLDARGTLHQLVIRRIEGESILVIIGTGSMGFAYPFLVLKSYRQQMKKGDLVLIKSSQIVIARKFSKFSSMIAHSRVIDYCYKFLDRVLLKKCWLNTGTFLPDYEPGCQGGFP